MAAYYSLMILYIVVTASIAMASERIGVSTTSDNNNTFSLDYEPWYNRKDREKICAQIPYDILRCLNNRSISLPGSTCATYDETRQLLEVGKCLYGHYIQ